MEVTSMPTNEKELNCNLLDQLTLLERIETAAHEKDIEGVLKQIEIEKRFINRKLYQEPPLNSN